MKLKKVLPVILLAVLLIWGIYDVRHKNNINNAATGNDNINTQVKADGNSNANIGIDKGDQAPDFELTTSSGKHVKLSDYRGKKVILNFWATWCPPCKAEIPDLEKFYSSYEDKGIIILGVNLTQAEKGQSTVKDFIKNYGITYPVALDIDGFTAGTYQVSAIPTSYIIDAQGTIREKVVGPMDFETMKDMLSSIN